MNPLSMDILQLFHNNCMVFSATLSVNNCSKKIKTNFRSVFFKRNPFIPKIYFTSIRL